MTPERWVRIKDLFEAALDREPDSRAGFLAQAAVDDPSLAEEVIGMLRFDENAGRLSSASPSAGSEKKGSIAHDGAELSPDPAPPQLATGVTLGSYRILEHIGAGGMGTVYKATDTKLGRPVALKLLRPELLKDALALARLEREARVLASLNHLRVAIIHGLEEHGGIQFLVLEYVPGPTLADRLRRGPLPIREAISVSKQIAEALEAAHALQIIHRDLKPANIKVSENGQVKVLDFGIAKTIERPSEVGPETSTPTLLHSLTDRLTILGTAAYMSPEQTRGKEVDTRADIWSFGCVLFEALTGRRAFQGETITETLAAVLEREPDWAALPNTTPRALQTLVKRCLRKDPSSRLRDVGDARIELEDLLSAPAAQEPAHQKSTMTRRTALSALLGAAAGAAVTGGVAISRYRLLPPRNLTRFSIEMPEGEFHVPSWNKRVALSPDGRYLGFNTLTARFEQFPYLRALGELESKRAKAAEGGAVFFFSPDSRWVGFIYAPGNVAVSIRKLPLGGGPPSTVCPTDNFLGATWAEDDNIYFVPEFPSGVSRVPAAGGQPVEIVKIDFDKGERQHKYPCALPKGNAVMFTTATAQMVSFDEAHIVAYSPRSGQRTVLLEGGTHPRYSPSGHLLYARDAKIFAVPFDPSRLKLTGQAFLAMEGVLMSRNTGVANFDVSASGDLAYVPGICDGGARKLVWVDRNGSAEPVPLPAQSYLHPRLSPDNRRLAIEIEGPTHDLYVYDFDRGVLTKLTTDGVSHWPIWSPDGAELAYRSGPMAKFRLWRVQADRSRPPKEVPAVGISQSAESWSPDGEAIAYTALAPGTAPGIMVTHVDGAHPAEPFASGKAPAGSAKFSPDGRWLAYCSNESGKAQVYVQAFPGPGPKIQVSNDGGTDPVWKRSGGELFYRNSDRMMAVSFSIGSTLKLRRPQELWQGRYSHGMSSSCGAPGATSSNYDVSADGNRFLMIQDDHQDRAISKQIIVVQGFADELRRLSA
jgi:serine/threonine-protein kinase